MRGKIEVLGAGALQGRIRAEDGSRIAFDLAGILAYDVGRLCVGHSVTFDVDKRAATAINVSREQETPPLPDKRGAEAQLRYMGFEQTGGVRTYRFERAASGEPTRVIIVTIDVKLFVKHRIGMQDGPTLCLRHLAVPENATVENQVIGEADMLAFIASRPAAGPSRAFRRKHTPPVPPAAQAVNGDISPERHAPLPYERPSAWPPRRG
jgi:hypothetical protein